MQKMSPRQRILWFRHNCTKSASDVGHGGALTRIRREMGDDRIDLRWDEKNQRWIVYYDAPRSGTYIVTTVEPCISIGAKVVSILRQREEARYSAKQKWLDMERERMEKQKATEKDTISEVKDGLRSYSIGKVTTSGGYNGK
jgi:hypothetical protein